MKIILTLLLFVSLYADVKKDMLELYQHEKYEAACNIGFSNFGKYDEDENFLSLYAFSCLKADYIDRLSAPVIKLKFTTEARANATYFSTILLQKKMLYYALVDGYKLKSLNLPTTDYVLSKVFDLYSQLENNESKEYYIFEDKEDKKRKYKLYLQKAERIDKMVIEEFYDTISVKRHVYW